MNTKNRATVGLVLAILLVASSLAPMPADDADSTVTALAKERITVIRQVLAGADERQRLGQAGGVDAMKWSRRLVEATRQAGLPRAELIAVLRESLKIAESKEQELKLLSEHGVTTMLEYLEAKDFLLEAKIALAQAEAK